MVSEQNKHLPGFTLKVIEDRCVSCYACVRECPAAAIEVKTKSEAVRIIPERCTACGSCYQVCPTEAITFNTDLEQIVSLLKNKAETIALIDPGISGEFPDIADYRSFVGMIKALGFSLVCDVSFGADLVARKYQELFKQFKGKYFISSKCPAVVYQVTKQFPLLTENLVPLVNPASAMARVVRRRYGARLPVVFISSCLSARLEKSDPAFDSGIDLHLTFKELRQLFTDFNIKEGQVEYQEFDPPYGRKGSLFPLTGGLMQAAGQLENLIESNFHSASGRSNMLDAIGEFNQSNDIHKHLDLFYCEGCIMGPGMTPGGRKFIRQTLVKDYTRKRLDMTDESVWREQVEAFQDLDLSRGFRRDDQTLPVPEESVVQEILHSIGKTDKDNTSRGCSACGYRSCHDFASAVALGLAKTEMCQTFGTKNRQEYINSLRMANENLAKTQKALEASERTAREERNTVKAYSDTISAVMERIPSGVIIADPELKVIQANQVMVNLLGEEAQGIHEIIPGLKGADVKKLLPTAILQLFSFCIQQNQELLNKDVMLHDKILNLSLFPIQKNTTYGAIFRDMSSPEVQKEEVIKRVTETIDKNLEMVQKIGFLLGEGAAETEKMLYSIIQSFQSRENSDKR